MTEINHQYPLYLHDQDNKTLYFFPSSPEVELIRNRRGIPEAWRISRTARVIRADNCVIGNRWLYSTSDRRDQRFSALQYTTRECALLAFEVREPRGIQVSKDEFLQLKSQYESDAGGPPQFDHP